jgi:hypothetical protein
VLCPAYQGIMTVLNYPKYGVPSDYNFLGNVTASVGFFRSSDLTSNSFIQLTNSVFNQNFSTGSDAAIWLFDNGYWTNYPVMSNPDAANYVSQVISAGGSIDSATMGSLDTLFNDLQNNFTQAGPSFYSVLEGFYPMLGTTSATQAINANGNTAYDLQFAGGWTFGSLGMQGNGINTAAYTGKFYVPVTGEELYNTHFSIYGTVPNNSPSNGDLSIVNGFTRNVTITLNKISNGQGRYEYDCNSGSDALPNLNSGDFVIISTNGSSTYAYQNGAPANPSSAGGISLLNEGSALYLGVAYSTINCVSGNGVSVNTFGWSSFGGFMSPTDMGNYQTIVNTFMTSIGRNTYTNP